MGWRGTLRSFEAAAHRAQRNAQRRARQQRLHQHAVAAAQAHAHARAAVEQFNARVTRLVSLHRSGSTVIAWEQRASATPPQAPQRSHAREAAARAGLEAYAPWRLSEILGLAARRRGQLEQALAAAQREDEVEYVEAAQKFAAAAQDYRVQKELAERLLRGDCKAMIETFNALHPFAAIADLAASFKVVSLPGRQMTAEVKALGEAVVPNQAVSMLKNGLASSKALTRTSHNGVYRDYVCGLVLRVARELFAMLPVEVVIVTVVEALLNAQTGNLENQPIVSACIPRQTFARLNLAAVDQFECLKNFNHTVDFRPATGFRPVQGMAFKPPGGPV